MNRCSRFRASTGLLALTAALVAGTASPALAQQGPPAVVKGQPVEELMSVDGFGALEHVRGLNEITTQVIPPGTGRRGPKVPFPDFANPDQGGPANGDGRDGERNRRFQNVFVNDPCLDPAPEAPFPENFRRTVQSETEIAVLNDVGKDKDKDDDDDDDGRGGDDDGRRGGDDDDDDDDEGGRLMVAGYNDSYGFYDNRQGLSGFSYSTNGGKLWIDAGGLPPLVPSGAPAGTPGSDAYFGDPVVVVHHRSKTFYYSSIYMTPGGIFSLSVNRGRFRVAPQQSPVESKANTRCENNPALHGVPDPPPFVQERIIWEPPVVAVLGTFLAPDDFLDKEWLYVDQNTGVLYLTYTRFGNDGSTPIELVRSFDGGRTWTPPSIIVPNLLDTFNQATMPVTTPTGRVIVTFFARTFPSPAFAEREQRIEAAFSDNCTTPAPCTFGPPVIVTRVDPQGEPLGYNRARATILNAPYINVDKGRDDGVFTKSEKKKSGFGNVYITYFDGLTPLAPAPAPPTTVFAKAADIFLSTSRNNGTTYPSRVKVNDDNTQTTHVFPSVQVNQKHTVFLTWIDRRRDPPRACRPGEQPPPGQTQCGNTLNDTWGEVSNSFGRSDGGDVRITDVSTDWFTREDARPDYGDYNSSEVLNFTDFVSIWADGRFPKGSGQVTPPPNPPRRRATPDTIFEIFGDGSGGGGGDDDDDDDGHGGGDDDD